MCLCFFPHLAPVEGGSEVNDTGVSEVKQALQLYKHLLRPMENGLQQLRGDYKLGSKRDHFYFHIIQNSEDS